MMSGEGVFSIFSVRVVRIFSGWFAMMVCILHYGRGFTKEYFIALIVDSSQPGLVTLLAVSTEIGSTKNTKHAACIYNLIILYLSHLKRDIQTNLPF